MILATIIGILVSLFSIGVTFFQTDADSARYLISAIIQSEAAIIAIVISLSLIAVQQTTSTYSARIIDIFKGYKRYPDLFLLMVAYIVCIAFSAVLLKIIKSQGSVTPFLEYCIWIVYVLFIVLLLALIPYISRTLEMFKPSTLIKLLSENISKESIELAIKHENFNNNDQTGQIKPINDTIQPIIDVLQGSMKSYDYETTRYGLRMIEAKTVQIIRDDTCDPRCKEVIVNRIIDHIKTIGIITTKHEMERSVNDTADTLQRTYDCLVEKGIYTPVDALVSALFVIGEQTINEKLPNSTVQILKVLSGIGIKSIEVEHQKIIQRVLSLIVIIAEEQIATENNPVAYKTLYAIVCQHAILSLKNIGGKIAEKEWEYETSMLIQGFDQIGVALIENTVIKGNADYLLRILLKALYSIAQNLMTLNLMTDNRSILILDMASEIHSIGIKAFNRYSGITDYSFELLNRLIADIIKLSSQDTSAASDYNFLFDQIDKLRSDRPIVRDDASKQC
jgi:hypothetical protein